MLSSQITAKQTTLDKFLQLIDHPTDENLTIKNIFLEKHSFEGCYIEDINKNGAKKITKLVENLDKFPNLLLIRSGLCTYLNCYVTSPLDEKSKMEKQALVTKLLCKAIASSPSLEDIRIEDIYPCFYQEIFNTINTSSKSIRYLDLYMSFYSFESQHGSGDEIVNHLVTFLSKNETLYSIHLGNNHCLGDANALKIIESIVNNPKSKIKAIELFNSGLSKKTCEAIRALCKEKNISIDLRHDFSYGDRTDYSYVAFCPDLSKKEYKTYQEDKLLEIEKEFRQKMQSAKQVNYGTRSFTVPYVSISEVIHSGDWVRGETYLAMRFVDLIKTPEDLAFVLKIIFKEDHSIMLKHFIDNHLSSVTGDIRNWSIPELKNMLNPISLSATPTLTDSTVSLGIFSPTKVIDTDSELKSSKQLRI